MIAFGGIWFFESPKTHEIRAFAQAFGNGLDQMLTSSVPKALARRPYQPEYDSFAPKISAALHVLFISTAENCSFLKAGEVMV